MNCTTLISHIRISKFVYIHGNVFHEKLDYRAHSIQFHPVVKLEITARSWITMIGPVPRIDPRRSVAWPVARSVKGNTSADFFRPFNALVYFSASAMSRITFRTLIDNIPLSFRFRILNFVQELGILFSKDQIIFEEDIVNCWIKYFTKYIYAWKLKATKVV